MIKTEWSRIIANSKKNCMLYQYKRDQLPQLTRTIQKKANKHFSKVVMMNTSLRHKLWSKLSINKTLDSRAITESSSSFLKEQNKLSEFIESRMKGVYWFSLFLNCYKYSVSPFDDIAKSKNVFCFNCLSKIKWLKNIMCKCFLTPS